MGGLLGHEGRWRAEALEPRERPAVLEHLRRDMPANLLLDDGRLVLLDELLEIIAPSPESTAAFLLKRRDLDIRLRSQDREKLVSEVVDLPHLRAGQSFSSTNVIPAVC